MKKIYLVSIFLLILFTSLVKNSTKEIEDKIFVKKENIRLLSAEFEDVMLEYNYLSAPEKLMKYQSQYFANKFKRKAIKDIKQITIEKDKLKISNFLDSAKANE